MLKIVITPTALYFHGLTDELQQELNKHHDLKHDSRAFYIQAEPQKLYKILLKLSYDYDIELV